RHRGTLRGAAGYGTVGRPIHLGVPAPQAPAVAAAVDSAEPVADIPLDPRSAIESKREFARVVQVSPTFDGSQFEGFVITPGRDEDKFAAMNLHPGDLLTAIDGAPLTDSGALDTVLATLRRPGGAMLQL